MVMPYGTKESQATSDKAPPKINFDELWLAADPLIGRGCPNVAKDS